MFKYSDSQISKGRHQTADSHLHLPSTPPFPPLSLVTRYQAIVIIKITIMIITMTVIINIIKVTMMMIILVMMIISKIIIMVILIELMIASLPSWPRSPWWIIIDDDQLHYHRQHDPDHHDDDDLGNVPMCYFQVDLSPECGGLPRDCLNQVFNQIYLFNVKEVTKLQFIENEKTLGQAFL